MLHFNANSKREQTRDRDGQLQWAISFPKSRKGEPVVKAINKPLTFIDRLMAMTWDLRARYPRYKKAKVLATERAIPPPVCSKYAKPVKAEVVAAHRSRFNL